ncbi:hypothetical protein I6A84_01480 [Frankia sp. CNm7]|uniref:Uncharacterized protein n=1 Tax=Frankia nepalensis TaxID=1836974 RepID=A0A937UND0_9ACTN|nr:hypothetical protein [Frankia nepalensis]MBL7497986.1 hypothetical protein [Frankia nepalensis]MBL7509067.1 hypothetical protein [Frankia nepalensis]MBL7516830.1 hypothetical protein [Frankia nepalensis]MBL7627827.1 hypothetical protein [Frankia nepalensis]
MLDGAEPHLSGEEGLPRLRDVYSDLVDDLVTMLREACSEDPIADSIADLPFHGVCRGYVLTAPEASPTPSVMEVGRGDEVIFLLGLDPSHSVVTWIDVLDGHGLSLTPPTS